MARTEPKTLYLSFRVLREKGEIERGQVTEFEFGLLALFCKLYRHRRCCTDPKRRSTRMHTASGCKPEFSHVTCVWLLSRDWNLFSHLLCIRTEPSSWISELRAKNVWSTISLRFVLQSRFCLESFMTWWWAWTWTWRRKRCRKRKWTMRDQQWTDERQRSSGSENLPERRRHPHISLEEPSEPDFRMEIHDGGDKKWDGRWIMREVRIRCECDCLKPPWMEFVVFCCFWFPTQSSHLAAWWLSHPHLETNAGYLMTTVARPLHLSFTGLLVENTSTKTWCKQMHASDVRGLVIQKQLRVVYVMYVMM